MVSPLLRFTSSSCCLLGVPVPWSGPQDVLAVSGAMRRTAPGIARASDALSRISGRDTASKYSWAPNSIGVPAAAGSSAPRAWSTASTGSWPCAATPTGGQARPGDGPWCGVVRCPTGVESNPGPTSRGSRSGVCITVTRKSLWPRLECIRGDRSAPPWAAGHGNGRHDKRGAARHRAIALPLPSSTFSSAGATHRGGAFRRWGVLVVRTAGWPHRCGSGALSRRSSLPVDGRRGRGSRSGPWGTRTAPEQGLSPRQA
jgi:hypothetical protein